MRKRKSLFTGDKALYLIVNSAVSGLNPAKAAGEALKAGAKVIQYREKGLPKKKLYKEAAGLRDLTFHHNALFIVNDYVDIAFAVNADGVHLGQEDLPVKEARKILGKEKIIGISTHNLKQAIDTEKAGADYIGFGPVFRTRTKDAGKPRGISPLKEIRRRIKIPIVAIGGITQGKAAEVLKSGADAIAVISGIMAGDIKTNTKFYLSAVRSRRA